MTPFPEHIYNAIIASAAMGVPSCLSIYTPRKPLHTELTPRATHQVYIYIYDDDGSSAPRTLTLHTYLSRFTIYIYICFHSTAATTTTTPRRIAPIVNRSDHAKIRAARETAHMGALHARPRRTTHVAFMFSSPAVCIAMNMLMCTRCA